MRTPNEEQKISIEHHGGVLLNAGAGSGKTYVLVEHIYFLTKKFTFENKKLSDLEFVKSLKSYLNKIVLMTFTNDAAGEIRNRVLKCFDEGDLDRAELIKVAIPSLTITTIHGFCMKLIRQGLINAPINMKLVDENQIRRKIEDLAKEWFELADVKEDVIIKNSTHVFNAMSSIFLSPELRNEWAQKDKEEKFNDEKFVKEIFELIGAGDFWNEQYELNEVTEFSGKAWYDLLEGLNRIKLDGPSLVALEFLWDEFSKYKRVTSPKNVSSYYLDKIEEAKAIKKFIKDKRDDLLVFKNNPDKFYEWQNYLLEAFDHIEKKYYFSEECSFSDLEYLVYKDLQNEEVVDHISSQYEYFIVDEYQDTSWIQFDILKKIVKNDLRRIFCVGDRKQAIYGFRGGELGVFNETEHNIPTNLFLSKNYRSFKSIIEFNNDFFEEIFSLGRSYEGQDNFSVKVDHQNYPFDDDRNGEIISFKKEVVLNDDIKKLSSAELSRYESESILDIIKDNCDKEICVLYKNLKPSKKLISLLIKNEIPFQAQVKIPYNDDPILVIFKSLIELVLEVRVKREISEKVSNYVNFYLEGVLRHFDIVSKKVITEENLYNFLEDVNLLGVQNSFIKFLYSLGISNSSFENNLKKIEGLCITCLDDVNEIWNFLNEVKSKSYSTRFSYLSNANVFIMTAHASKGLQFDNIILGGVHNNGRKIVNHDVVGKLPSSFKWTPEHHRKKLYKSPYYIYEQLLEDHKNFSESKRLLYVACTRAVERIYWVDLYLNEKPQFDIKDSWICALRLFTNRARVIEATNNENLNSIKESNAPLYFIDNLGIDVSENGVRLGAISELSVTKLSMIALCSRKFYYSQILKLDEDIEEFYKDEDITIEKRAGISDAERGTRIHYEIENYIKGNEVKISDFEVFDFVKNLIDSKKEESCVFNSEKEIKFSFFGQMVTGVPDLFISKNEVITEIWDFKTGLCEEDDKRQYFYQLLTYAYGLKNLGYKLGESVKLSIILVDQKDTISKEILTHDISKELYESFSKLSELSVQKINHCRICLYGNLCHKQ